jgi:hypothetical protein
MIVEYLTSNPTALGYQLLASEKEKQTGDYLIRLPEAIKDNGCKLPGGTYYLDQCVSYVNPFTGVEQGLFRDEMGNLFTSPIERTTTGRVRGFNGVRYIGKTRQEVYKEFVRLCICP